MKVFVDIRAADIPGFRFAFWDTTVDAFMMLEGKQAWHCWEEFAESWNRTRPLLSGEERQSELEWYRILVPDWVHTDGE